MSRNEAGIPSLLYDKVQTGSAVIVLAEFPGFLDSFLNIKFLAWALLLSRVLMCVNQ